MFMKELRGDDLVAVDGRIGVLDDLYIDEERWIVRYVAVHTCSWLLGRRLLLPAQLVGTPAPGGDAIPWRWRAKMPTEAPGWAPRQRIPAVQASCWATSWSATTALAAASTT